MKRYICILFLIAVFLTSCHAVEKNENSLSGESTEGLESMAANENTENDNETEPPSSSGKAPYTSGDNEQVSSDIYTEELAESILDKLTLEEKVGQLFLARNPKSSDEGLKLIESCHVGGIIFFGRDFRFSTPEKFRGMLEQYDDASFLPLLTAVDEEGGSVCRASLYRSFRSEKFASPAELYAEGGLEGILADAVEKSDFLLDLGLNLNLAPVADISLDENDFIFERALGLGCDETAEYVSEVVKAMRGQGIMSALKHFPGYGNNEDTHTGIAYDKRSFESIKENDLVPFIYGIEAGTPIVMVSHNIVECIDPTGPASLSGAVISLLRDELGFEGVIMTDDLSMDAVGEYTDSSSAAVMAVLAGCDLLCCSDTETQYAAVLSAVRDGRIDTERLDSSVLRIIKMKIDYGLITDRRGTEK